MQQNKTEAERKKAIEQNGIPEWFSLEQLLKILWNCWCNECNQRRRNRREKKNSTRNNPCMRTYKVWGVWVCLCEANYQHIRHDFSNFNFIRVKWNDTSFACFFFFSRFLHPFQRNISSRRAYASGWLWLPASHIKCGERLSLVLWRCSF